MIVPTDRRTQPRRVRLLHVAVAEEKIAGKAMEVIGPGGARLVDDAHVPTDRRGRSTGGSYIEIAGQDFPRVSRTRMLSQKVPDGVVAISCTEEPARPVMERSCGNRRGRPGRAVRRLAEDSGRAQLVGQGKELKPEIPVKWMAAGALRHRAHPGEHIAVIVPPLEERPADLAQVVDAHHAVISTGGVSQQRDRDEDQQKQRCQTCHRIRSGKSSLAVPIRPGTRFHNPAQAYAKVRAMNSKNRACKLACLRGLQGMDHPSGRS